MPATTPAERPRVVVVTGASRGIGAEVAVQCAARGDHLVLLARSTDDLAAVADRCRDAGASEVTTLPCDLRDLDAVDALSRDLLTRVGAPDVVVCNAGLSIHRRAVEQSERLHDHVRAMHTHHLGHLALLLPWLPAMAARRSARIVATSSTVARTAIPGWATYVASKGAFDLWLRSVTPELARDGITTAIVELGLVATAMSAPTYGTRPRFALTAEQAAERVVRAIDGRPGFRSPWWARLAAIANAVAPMASSRVAGWVTLRR